MSIPPSWSPAPEPPDPGESTQPAPASAPVDAYGAPQYGIPQRAAEPGINPYGVPAGGAVPAFPQYGYEYGYGQPSSPQHTNGLAIASLMTILVSLLTVVTAPVGLSLGAIVTLGVAAVVGFFFAVATVKTVPGIEGAST